MTDNDYSSSLVRDASMLVTAIGSFIPEERVSNANIAHRFGKDQDFLERKLGFSARAIKPASMKTSDMCVRAFENLEKKHALDRAQIDLLVVVTQNPDQKIPHTSAIVHQKLGLGPQCATFDISQGCAGYAIGLAAVKGWMSTLDSRNAVLVTCDPYSKIVDPNDAATAMLFGDAATATLVSARAEQGYLLRDAVFGTLPDSFGCLTCEDLFFMDGRQVAMNVMNSVPDAIQAFLARHALSLNDISRVLFHQASLYVIETLRIRLNISAEAAPFAAGDIGNSISSSIPIILEPFIDNDDHENILICGFGVGFSWSLGLLQIVKR